MEALSARIDALLMEAWSNRGIVPATRSTDSEFARRVYLDLIGRIPTVSEVRAFLDADDASKRDRLIQRLVESPAHAKHMAVFWRREWLPRLDTAQVAVLMDEFDDWLANTLYEQPRYDKLVASMLTAAREPGRPQAAVAFLAASDFKPEDAAANATRAFLGMNLECAQCHNHPFARWTQDQFWETAAFFTRPTAEGAETGPFTLTVPNSTRTVRARLLSGVEPEWPRPASDDAGRRVLSGWITSRESPYFAKNGVNRIWAKLFGVGLAELQGDLDDPAQSQFSKILEELGTSFADVGFDLQVLIGGIARSDAYQLTSRAPGTDSDQFARAAVRGLTGEQLYDSLQTAAGWTPARGDLDPKDAQARRNRFVKKFESEQSGGATTRSILQSLTMMNGELIAESTTAAPILQAVTAAPFLNLHDKVELLYLSTLSRKPAKDETRRATDYLSLASDPQQEQHSLGDSFWALLNSSEFNTNH